VRSGRGASVRRVAVRLVESYGDLLAALKDDRRAHSLAVGRKAEAAAAGIAPAMRADLTAAAVLHDIGYGHVETGFHPLDGARFLARAGFSPVVCNLVVRHSASTYEAEERGIDLAVYADFAVDQDLSEAHAVLWWADLTTGPQGQDVTVEDRLDEIGARYGADDVVTRFVDRTRPVLLAAGQSPSGRSGSGAELEACSRFGRTPPFGASTVDGCSRCTG
jgi:putative nucleotidyltransferase with HDIG domain